jgi:hypothetical protein
MIEFLLYVAVKRLESVGRKTWQMKLTTKE